MRNIIYLITIILCSWGATAHAQTHDNDRQLIRKTLENYIEGTSYRQPDLIAKAFHPDAVLILSKKDHPIWKITPETYRSWFTRGEAGSHTGRIGEIVKIHIDGHIATAKVEILIPTRKTRFADLFLLKKVENQWLIISKTADRQTSNTTGKRILFIVSSADKHGSLDQRAGASFGELVEAYDTFKKAGYTVDFISPNGGATPLSYIDTTNPIHKKHLYDADFMDALAHTKTASQVQAGDYAAVHYIGGSNAVYQVPEDQMIQKLVMQVYEDHQGIISAVCHGTAGIVHLKKKDGSYLVSGKRITGYPEDYERQDAAYFKAFPFLIRKTTEERQGKFHFSPRNTPHVEIDGRVITGQNYLSSAGVARAIIQKIEAR